MPHERHIPEGAPHQRLTHGHGGFASEHAVERLILEGELASALDAEAIGRARSLLEDDKAPVRRVLDLGCGPGVTTVALAGAFPQAAVVAVDSSPAMLEQVRTRATRAGCGARVETRELDIDADMGRLGSCQLGWASMSIHHAVDQTATLVQLAGLIEPGGVLCLLERAAPTAVQFAGELDAPGLWIRLHEARTRHAESHAHGAVEPEAYPATLRAAGLDLLVDRTLTVTMDAARGPARTFAAGHLRQEAAAFAALSDADRAALRGRADDDGVSAWKGAEVTLSRRLLIARHSDA